MQNEQQRATQLATTHLDILHGIAWDYHGLRLATCSADQRIAVYDKHPDSPSLVLNDAWHAHDAAVSHIRWAHPSFGRVLVSTSFDASVRVWEEAEHEPRGSGRRWRERARLVDARGRVVDLNFGPVWLGLILATIAEDGIVRLYEASDTTNVAYWGIFQEFEASGGMSGLASHSNMPMDSTMSPYAGSGEGNSLGGVGYCLSWCCTRFTSPMLAVACGPRNIIRVCHCSCFA